MNPREPAGSLTKVERLTALLLELGELLDGSMESLTDARRGLGDVTGLLAVRNGELERQLHGAADRLEKLAELVHASMQSASRPLGSVHLARARPATLGDAVAHAVDVLSPLARELKVEVEATVADAAASEPAGTMYTVILNGLQNAIESAGRRGAEGRVRVIARADAAPASAYGRDGRGWFAVEIRDNGGGLPRDASRVFDLGFTTKPKGAGVGLAVARNAAQGMGGTIELLPATSGALLRVRFPSVGVHVPA